MSDSNRHTPFLYEVILKAFRQILGIDNDEITISNPFLPSVFLNTVVKKVINERTNNSEDKIIEKILIHDLEKKETLKVCLNRVNLALDKELSFYKASDDSDTPVADTERAFRGLSEFLETIETIKETQEPFLPAAKLNHYLSSYYTLFRYLFSDTILLDESIGFGRSVADFFAVFPGKKGESLYSPYAVESTLKLYKALEDAKQFYETGKNSQIDPIVKEMVVSIYATKAFRDFRRIIIKDGKQYLLSCENTDKLQLKNVADLSSIEMVKPIRLFGKIKRYIDNLKKDTDKSINCKIIIIGTVYIEPDFIGSDQLSAYSPELDDLCRWIDNNYSEDPKIQQFEIKVHVNANSFSGFNIKPESPKELDHEFSDKMKVSFHFDDYTKLSSKKGLDDLLKPEDALLFFLDCPFLYDNLHIVSHDQHLYDWVQRFAGSYSDESLSLAELGAVQRIQNQLNMFLLYRVEKTAHFERRLRDSRIRYISDQVNEKKKEKDDKTEVFIFISSQSSINASEYARTFQIRKEEYNSKEMCLLHFGREKGGPLSYKKNDEFNTKIEFTLWNILVNTDPGLIKELKKELSFLNNKFAEDLASEVYIEFNWEKNHPFSEAIIKIRISKRIKDLYKTLCKDEEDRKMTEGKKIKSIIQSYFNIIFFNQLNLEPTILKCMRNSFYNVFFGKISNVFQAIAFNRIQAALESGRPIAVTVETVNKPKLPEEIKNQEDNNDRDFVTARRKAYVEVIENLSKAYPSPTLRDVLVSRMRAAGMLPLEVYDNIIRACEDSDYTEDELYQNTIMARSDLL